MVEKIVPERQNVELPQFPEDKDICTDEVAIEQIFESGDITRLLECLGSNHKIGFDFYSNKHEFSYELPI